HYTRPPTRSHLHLFASLFRESLQFSPCLLLPCQTIILLLFFFFNDTATTEIYTLSLHDALPIYTYQRVDREGTFHVEWTGNREEDRKSTRLNSSHVSISYAVFCLKKKTTSQEPLKHRPSQAKCMKNCTPLATAAR